MFAGLSWVLWLSAAVVGIGGGALYFFAPALAAVVANVVFGFLRMAVSTRIGVGIMCAIAAFFAGDIHRARLDQKSWDKAVANYRTAQVERDRRIDDLTKKVVDAGISADVRAQQEANDAVERFKKTIPHGGVCRLGPDNARWLRDIAGQTQRKRN